MIATLASATGTSASDREDEIHRLDGADSGAFRQPGDRTLQGLRPPLDQELAGEGKTRLQPFGEDGGTGVGQHVLIAGARTARQYRQLGIEVARVMQDSHGAPRIPHRDRERTGPVDPGRPQHPRLRGVAECDRLAGRGGLANPLGSRSSANAGIPSCDRSRVRFWPKRP